MRFTSSVFLFGLIATSIAAPFPDAGKAKVKRALTVQPYSEFQVSDGVAGNALAEVNAKFPIGDDLTAVSQADLDIMSDARKVAESAETDAFNPQIEAAGKDTAAGTALQNGKIKNKVLKLQLQVLIAQVKIAQGDTSAATQTALDTETKKLNNNIALDKAAAGEASQSVQVDG